MNTTRTLPQRLMATSLGLLLVACSATRYVGHHPSDPRELARYVLVIEENLDGQVVHAWKPIKDFDLAKYQQPVSTSAFEGQVVRTAWSRDCEAERDKCEEMCFGSLVGEVWAHASNGSRWEHCRRECRPAYLDCCRLQEQAEGATRTARFSTADEAVDWLKRNRKKMLVGAVVVIAGVAFVVVVAGSGGGGLLLAPALLMVSSEAPLQHQLVVAKP